MKRYTFSSVMLAALTISVAAFAQSDPRLTAGQLPVIVLFPDTSGSMEYTDLGDEEYPQRDPFPGTHPNLVSTYGDPLPATNPQVWVPGTFMDIDEGPNRGNGPRAFGSCITWEPESCNNYERPSWNAREGDVPPIWMPGYQTGLDRMRGRFVQQMRGDCTGTACGPDVSIRLHWLSQPRHVTVKEILTGDMILLPSGDVGGEITGYDRNQFGPGCWFVPRQRDASIQPSADQQICDGENDFEDLPDHDEPRPHFQEVYDGQLTNGLMDALTGSAIFAVVGFDGYRDDINWNDAYSGSDFRDLNDEIDFSDGEGAGNCDGDGNGVGSAGRCYDLGIYRVVAPNTLQIPSRFLPELSAFSQIAVRDFGYLNSGTNADEFELTPDESDSSSRDWMGASFSEDFDNYYEPHYLGKQPIARATPVAAAMHDLYRWFAGGQAGVDTFNPDSNAYEGDDFFECRPKHVIVLSDGRPDPELGEPTLTAAFGNDRDQYVYGSTEAEIDQMVNDVSNMVGPSAGGFDPLYSIRVHVVGLNIGDPEAVDKLTNMAMMGKSCAGEALGADWQGAGCTNGICLVDQPAAAGYTYDRPDGSSVPCPYPAMILDQNDRDSLQAGLSLLFNEIIGASAISSRTRTIVTNRIDMDAAAFAAGGQHRVFSGVKIDGSQWWKGIVNRQTQACPNLDSPTVTELHEEVGNQVTISSAGAASDSRRIFTSFNETLFDYTQDPPIFRPFGGAPSGIPRLPMVSKFAQGAADEFRPISYIKNGTTTTLDRTRIRFEPAALFAAFQILNPSATSANFLSYFNAAPGEVEQAIDNFSGRIPEKVGQTNGGNLPSEAGRALGGFLNSNPVVVEPPNLELPIESYRAFKAQNADRSTMIYVNTMDGILHALHAGDRIDKVRVRNTTPANVAPGADSIGDSADQREAFAYIPQLIHQSLTANLTNQPYFMDGQTTVKDVRLCRASTSSNPAPICQELDNGIGQVNPADQWRTVLVQSGGLASDGMYALDITRPGGPRVDAGNNLAIVEPDPMPMWEFNRGYEVQQIQTTGLDARWTGNRVPTNIGSCADETEFWSQSMVGLTSSEPEIATVLMTYNNSAGAPITEQRPVVLFGGGANDANLSGCQSAGAGYAIYVMDLQTGSIIRRFVEWFDDGPGAYVPFVDDSARFTGSPALFDASPGSVATRGFIGDENGRMFRIDLTDPDPDSWEVHLFFDPNTDSVAQSERDAVSGTSGFPFGPAAFKPAIATNDDRQAVVIYGLGDPSDTAKNNEAQAVLSITDLGDRRRGTLNWILAMEEGEKLTGSPIVFNNVTYFPSYVIPSNDACEPGLARIYGLRFDEDDPVSAEPFGIWQNNPTIVGSPSGILRDSGADIKWFGPEDPTLIRGLTLTFRSPCNIDQFGTSGFSYSEGGDASPQIIAQTSGEDITNALTNPYGASGTNSVDRLVLDIEKPRSTTMTMDWSVVNN